MRLKIVDDRMKKFLEKARAEPIVLHVSSVDFSTYLLTQRLVRFGLLSEKLLASYRLETEYSITTIGLLHLEHPRLPIIW